jgi:Ser/Thr protein kinase RdoA (MazF antagonist)
MTTLPQLSAPIALGRTAEIYDWKDGYILKLYYDWCPPTWLEHEARVARVIVAAGIPTPAVDETVEINGRRGIVYERVQGVSMLQDLNARPWTIFKHARELADLQMQFNQLSVPELRGYRDSMGDAICHAAYISDAARTKLLEILETLPAGSSLCHGDFHPGNVIISPRGPIVIDWMTAVSGSPWADVARTSLLLTIGPKAAGKQLSPFVRMFIGLYYDAYLKRYKSLRSGSQNELKRWMPVVAAARLNEQIEPEREALLQMIKESL